MDILRNTAIAFTALAFQTATAEILYDLAPDSSSLPAETTLIADSSLYTPSSINFGELEVSPNFNDLAGNWVVFNTPACGTSDQIQFDLPLAQEEIYVSTNVNVEGQSGSSNAFSISIDSTAYGARSFSFHGLGNLSLFNFGSKNLGSYSNNRTYKVDLYANTLNNILTIKIDGEEVHSGTFGSSDITSIRLTQSPWTGAPSNCGNSTIAINDLKIYEQPEDLIVQSDVSDEGCYVISLPEKGAVTICL
jgi:hypothetical protein